MYVIVGLGNPGDKYAHTRHNVGFDVVTLLADRLGARFDKLKCAGKDILDQRRHGIEPDVKRLLGGGFGERLGETVGGGPLRLEAL